MFFFRVVRGLHAFYTILEFLSVSVNQLVYDTSNLIVQHQPVELIEHKRYIRFVANHLENTNSNQSVKLTESFINTKPILIKSLDSCNSFLHENNCIQ